MPRQKLTTTIANAGLCAKYNEQTQILNVLKSIFSKIKKLKFAKNWQNLPKNHHFLSILLHF